MAQSVGTATIAFGRAGNAGDKWMLVEGNPSNASPYTIAYDVNVRRFAISNSNTVGAYRILMYRYDANVTNETLVYTSPNITTRTYYTPTDLTLPVNAGQCIGIYIQQITGTQPANIVLLLTIEGI
jgi:hypothetical protein